VDPPARRLLATSVAFATVAGVLYVAALFATGAAEDCDRQYAGQREGSSLAFERSYWPPEGICELEGADRRVRVVETGWTWAAWPIGALFGVALVCAVIGLARSRHEERRPSGRSR
jgi:hypothetical protein